MRSITATLLLNFKFEPVPEHLAGWEARTVLTHHPAQVNVRLTKL